MGLIDEFAYQPTRPNAVQRLIQRMASQRLGSRLMRPLLYRLDRPIFRLTRGRATLTSSVANVPLIMLTTTGAKSGEPRTMPLLAIPIGADLAILGTNYGSARTPGWVYNLEANPDATAIYRDKEVAVTARKLSGDEYEAAFIEAAKVYPGYAKYREWAPHREIRAFVLSVAPGGSMIAT